MIFKGGLTTQEKMRREFSWNLWFAWYPVCVGNDEQGTKIWAWFSTIKRRKVAGLSALHWHYVYDIIQTKYEHRELKEQWKIKK